MDGTIRLIDDYLDDALTDASPHQFSDWLRADEANVQQFAFESLVHSLLYDMASERRVQSNALAHAASEDDEAWAFSKTERSRAVPEITQWQAATSTGHRWFGGWLRTITTLAAMLLIATVLGFLGYHASRPQVAAMLTQTSNCHWKGSAKDVRNGSLLTRGQELELADGRALITFVSGAQVSVEGPTTLRLESSSAARLLVGHLSAKVPPQAVGFAINIAKARFVDLGTEFSVRLLPHDGFELQVFNGLVELQVPDKQNGPHEAPLRISEGTAVRCEDSTQDVKSVHYDVQQRIEMP